MTFDDEKGLKKKKRSAVFSWHAESGVRWLDGFMCAPALGPEDAPGKPLE